MNTDIMKSGGVLLNEPNPFTAKAIENSVNKYLEGTPHEGALLSVITLEGINLVLVKKKENKFGIEAWIGKKWGKPVDAGIQGVVYF